MPTTLKTANEVLSNYRNFPRSDRNSQEDIIASLRGEKIRGKIIYEMSPEQVYSIAQRLYNECRETIGRNQIKKANLETRVKKPQEQIFLFDLINRV